MKRIYVIVEGQTEEEFIKSLLQKYFTSIGIYSITPIKIQTSPGHKGGFKEYQHLKNDINKILKQQDDVIVTTFVDFYGLPSSIPKYSETTDLNGSLNKVQFLEQAIAEDINDVRFYPYIQLHEFESLLFSSINGFQKYWGNEPKIIDKINSILSEFSNPEEINDSSKTAPSKRLKNIIKRYDKIVFGNILALEIGLIEIRKKCKRFDKWINTLIEKAK
jgi:hypothetical protein